MQRLSTPEVKSIEINRNLELFRRVSDIEAKKINSELKALSDIPEKITQFKDATLGIWGNKSVLAAKHIPYVALLAYQNNDISEFQFATFALFYSAVSRHGFEQVETRSLLESDQLIEENKKIIEQTIFEDELSNIKLSPQELAVFYDEIKKLPESERRFFLVPDLDKDEQSMAVSLEKNVFFKLFGRVNDKRIIASLGVQQAYLNAKFKSNACKLIPVLGFSSLEDIKQNGLQNTRDMGIPFPNVFLPKKADTFLAPDYIFSMHDFYHAYMASFIPLSHRKTFVEIADSLYQKYDEQTKRYDEVNQYYPAKVVKVIHSYTHSITDKVMHAMGTACLDMEFPSYRFQGGEISASNKFWFACMAAYVKTEGTVYQKYSNNEIALYNGVDTSKLNMWDKLFNIDLGVDKTKPVVWNEIFKTTDHTDKISKQPRLGFKNILSWLRIEKQSFDEELLNYITDVSEEMFTTISKIWHETHLLKTINDKHEELKKLKESKKYTDEKLKMKVKQFIEDSIVPYFNLDNIIDVFQLATDLSIVELQQAAMIFMSKNLKALMLQNNFRLLQQDNPARVNGFLYQVQKSRFFAKLFKTAVEENNTVLLDLILKPGLDNMDRFGYTPLDYAIMWGKIDLVKKLLAQGASMYKPKEASTLPSLFLAIYHAQGEIFGLLIDKGFDLSYRHNGKKYVDFYEECCQDSDTFAGMWKKFFSVIRKDGKYDFSNTREALTFFAAKKEFKKFDKEYDYPAFNDDPKSFEKALIERIKKDISWACKRLPKDEGKVDSKPKFGF